MDSARQGPVNMDPDERQDQADQENPVPLLDDPSSISEGASDSPDAPPKTGIPSTSVYPHNLAQKQLRRFARSADKRQSVHLLGNIEHLQHHFMKFGLAASEAPDLRGPIRPALGLAVPTSTASTSVSSPITSSSPPRSHTPYPLLPPSPLKPATVPMPPYPLGTEGASKINLAELRSEAGGCLEEVERVWELALGHKSGDGIALEAEQSSKVASILDLLKVTLQAITVVRTFALAIPTSQLPILKTPNKFGLGGLGVPSRTQVRRVSGGPGNRQSISTPSRPAGRAVSVGAFPVASRSQPGQAGQAPTGPHPAQSIDPLVEVRKAAIEVLTTLKEMEERYRIEGSNLNILSSGNDDAGSPVSVSRALSPSPRLEAADIPAIAGPSLGLGLPNCVPSGLRSVSSASSSTDRTSNPSTTTSPPLLPMDEAYFFAEREGLQEGQKKTWYERLKDGGDGWLYRGDVSVSRDLEAEGKVVKGYLDTVERVLFTGSAVTADAGEKRRRAWSTQGKSRRSSLDVQTGRKQDPGSSGQRKQLSELDEGDEEAIGDIVPAWAREDWAGTDLSRAHECILGHLPYNLMILLPHPSRPDFESMFLNRLSDGFILISVYNAAIRRAEASWGFVVQEDIHDTIEEDADMAAGEETEGGSKAREWTFRRAGNMRAWGAALRHRYRIPLVFPTQVTALKHAVPLEITHAPQRKVSDTATTSIKLEGIMYDPLHIARKGEGWEDVLKVVCEKWVTAVAREVRAHASAGRNGS